MAPKRLFLPQALLLTVGRLALAGAALAWLCGATPAVYAQAPTAAPSAGPASGQTPQSNPAAAGLFTGSAVPTPQVSRLPEGLTVRTTGTAVELVATLPGQGPTTVASVPLIGSSFATLHVSGFLYLARGAEELVVLDVQDVGQPRIVGAFSAGGEVVGLWGGSGALIIQRRDGAALLYDLGDPVHPRYQRLLTPPAYDPSQEVTGTRPPPPQQQNRFAVSVRPFLFFANGSRVPTSGGSILDLGYQFAKVGGLWWGIELSPFVISSYYNGAPTVNSRVWFGYSARKYALGLSMGSGYTSLLPLVQFGPIFRFGRLDGVHSTLRLTWSVLNPVVYPVSGQLTLDAPISRRFGLRYDFTGDSAMNGFHTTLGLQTYVGGDRRWKTTVLTTALGFAFMQTVSGFGTTLDQSPRGHLQLYRRAPLVV